jgi:hypothetical protein
MIRAVNEGVPLVIGRPLSPVTGAVRTVAQAVMGIETQQPMAPVRRGLLRRARR